MSGPAATTPTYQQVCERVLMKARAASASAQDRYDALYLCFVRRIVGEQYFPFRGDDWMAALKMTTEELGWLSTRVWLISRGYDKNDTSFHLPPAFEGLKLDELEYLVPPAE